MTKPRDFDLQDIDRIEAVLDACQHPHVADGYCIICGALEGAGRWVKPHWRDQLVKLLQVKGST